MAMKGWRRVGIVLSLIRFLGFGVFLWRLLVDELVAPYSYSLQNCRLLEDSANDGLQVPIRPGNRTRIARRR
jgi:hypothetical protein